MSSRLYEAIVTRWNDKSLDDTFLGGLFYGEAPAGAVYPFVVVLSLGNTPTQWTSTSEYRQQRLQFTIYYQEQEFETDPVSKVGTLMRAFDSAMSFAPLELASSAGNVLEIRRARGTIDRDPDADNVWAGRLTYNVSRRLSVDYDPA